MAGKVRAALLSVADVIDVFVGDDILVHMKAGGTLDVETVKKALAAMELDVTSCTKGKLGEM